MTPLPRAAGRALRSAALLACLAGAALGQDSAAARRNEARALADHDRVMLHTGSPLDLRGIEEDGNDFRARTPALARASRTMAMVDADENYRRRREMYESGARFSAPPRVVSHTASLGGFRRELVEDAPSPAPAPQEAEDEGGAASWLLLALAAALAGFGVWHRRRGARSAAPARR